VPSDILARVNEFARDHDITFVVHESFDVFEDLDIDRGGYGVHPGFTPAVSPQGQWIEARMFGKPIATMAAQPIDLATTLTSHLETEGLYPSDRDRWELYGEARAMCDGITSFAIFTGGYLIAPDFRASNNPEPQVSRLLMSILPRLNRELARQRWMPEHFFFTVKAGRNLAQRYNPEALATGLRWWRDGSLLDGVERVVGYMSAGYVERGADELVRGL
jgi:hypothetical protein